MGKKAGGKTRESNKVCEVSCILITVFENPFRNGVVPVTWKGLAATLRLIINLSIFKEKDSYENC